MPNLFLCAALASTIFATSLNGRRLDSPKLNINLFFLEILFLLSTVCLWYLVSYIFCESKVMKLKTFVPLRTCPFSMRWKEKKKTKSNRGALKHLYHKSPLHGYTSHMFWRECLKNSTADFDLRRPLLLDYAPIMTNHLYIPFEICVLTIEYELESWFSIVELWE